MDAPLVIYRIILRYPAQSFSSTKTRDPGLLRGLWAQGIAVLEPLVVPPGLLALHAVLARTLQAIGVRTDERPFRPHVTLARHAQGASLPAEGARWSWPEVRAVMTQNCGIPGIAP